jgi:3-oxoacyl-[acyl-carrier-protein] synthase II
VHGDLKEGAMGRRVVVTGMGTVNPLGNNVQDSWKRIKAGENGIGRITRFDVADFPSKIAGEVKDFAPEKVMESKDARRMDRFTQYAMAAGVEAMAQAGLGAGQVDPERFAVIVGNGIGGIETLESALHRLVDRGPKGVHPLFVPMMIMNEVASNIAIRFQANGPCFCVVTACASSNDAMGDAWRLIREGRVDVAIAGGTEAGITPLALAGFCQLQAVSTKRNDDPSHASRPFDRDRDGFVMGEGAGILVLEELEHARRRGAAVLAELAGYGSSCDANHLTAPHPEGRGAVQAIKEALSSADAAPGDVDYVNAHGTSTPINDPIETKAIKAVFGDHARKLRVSSTKSMHGHLLGGAGGLEAVVTVMAIRDQFFPPTRNLENPDPACDLDYVPNTGSPGRIRAAISNALGFGGHNAMVLFKEFAG